MASCWSNEDEEEKSWEEEPSEEIETPVEKLPNHNWIRSFSERVRSFRGGEFEEGISAIRRRKLAGKRIFFFLKVYEAPCIIYIQIHLL